MINVTGTSSEFREATAKLLTQNGAKLVLAARREDRMKNTVKEIEQDGSEVDDLTFVSRNPEWQ